MGCWRIPVKDSIGNFLKIFSQNVKDSVKRASIRIELSSENIAGVQLPMMYLKDTEELGIKNNVKFC